MGDPKFSRKKYVTPSHPWQGERIARENELVRKYGLKNKTELWRFQSLLRIFRKRARELQAKIRYGDKQAEKEMEELLKRLDKMGILGTEATLDDVLVLDAESLLGRRLQTMAYLKGLSYSQKQARQFIVHGHVAIGDRCVTVPGYMVKREEEEKIAYLSNSPIANDLHPARPKEEMEEDVKGEAAEEKAPEKEDKAPAEEPKPEEKKEKPPEKPKEEEKPPEDKAAEEKPAPEKKEDEAPKEAEPKPEEKGEEPPKMEGELKPEDKEAPAKEKEPEKPAEKKPADEKPKAEKPEPQDKKEESG